MGSWVLSSNPTTTYHAAEWLEVNEQMDWISRNNFEIGDTVYIYEVLPPSGRGGIIYETRVVETGLTAATKIDDEGYWVKGSYPSYITGESRFNRLRRVSKPRDGIIPYRILKEHGFAAPQVGAHSLEARPNLLKFIQGYFG